MVELLELHTFNQYAREHYHHLKARQRRYTHMLVLKVTLCLSID